MGEQRVRLRHRLGVALMTWWDAPAEIPAGARVYAVGDVHGCADRLARIHAAVSTDIRENPADAELIHLGDYIDRGPQSAGVIERVIDDPVPGATVTNLIGNHETMMLRALEGDPRALYNWRTGGGIASLRSWGADPRGAPTEWMRHIPKRHRDAIAEMPIYRRVSGYLFVHAGVRPGVPLDAQTVDDLTWTRGPFLESEMDHGFVVVHGHTPTRAPEVRHNRVGIDTGAVFGGALTCVVLEGRRLRFITA